MPPVVGYQTKQVRQYLSVQLPTFDGVTVDGIDIQKIVPSIEGMESGDFTIQFYNQFGIQTASYPWVLDADSGLGADGWVQEDWSALVERTFEIGEAFNVMCVKEGGNLTYSGSVVVPQVVVPVRQYLSAQGNLRAVSVNIQDIVPAVAESDVMESGDFTIQLYNQFGIQTASYPWVLDADSGLGADGWVQEDWSALAEVTFVSGEGFNVMAAKDGGTLTFPALSL